MRTGPSHSQRDAPRAALVAGALAVVAAAPGGAVAAQAQPPACTPGGEAVTLTGQVRPAEAKTYELLQVEVAPGTTRIEIGYRWHSNGEESQADRTVVDLGLWDTRGYDAPQGFRGWSGSRQGRLHLGQPPVFVQADAAERGYVPGPIEPGIWYVELGYGAVHSEGGSWEVEVRCLDVATGQPWQPDAVDATHVARQTEGWYRGDFHLHGYHSNPEAPEWEEVIEHARAAQLDIVPVTEYVTNVHWGELGPVQRDNPDLLIWPGREVITYFGHAVVLGETPSTIEYRHGFEDVSLGDVQRLSVADGALFQVAHPTTFPGEAFASRCRGCEFTLGEEIDWDLVDTIEVVTGPVVVDPETSQRPEPGVEGIANPFVPTAVQMWDSLLMQGHRVTAVSGSDDKLGPGYGMTATMVFAPELSRAAIAEALRSGHAYVEANGADSSPKLEMSARAPDGQSGIFGDTLVASQAQMTVTVRGGHGEELVLIRNGEETQRIPITEDIFTFTFTAERDVNEGPLGTFWRVETHDDVSLTALGNPIFLADGPSAGSASAAAPSVRGEPGFTG